MCFGGKSSSSKPAPTPQMNTFTPVTGNTPNSAAVRGREAGREGTFGGEPSSKSPSMPGSAMGSELGNSNGKFGGY